MLYRILAMKKRLLGLVLVLSPMFVSVAGQTETLEKSLRPLMENAGKVQITLPENNAEASQAAESLFRFTRSDAFQEKIQKEHQRIAERFFGATRKDEDGSIAQSPEEEDLALNERFYLFVSSSMPLATLRTYAADLARLNDPRFVMVLRGFIGGAKRIGPTASFITDVLKADPGCVFGTTQECAMRDIPFIVDPLLFRSSGILQVPAMAYLPNMKTDTLSPKEDSSSARMSDEPLIVYGDASLGYTLELMARQSGSQSLATLAAKLVPIP